MSDTSDSRALDVKGCCPLDCQDTCAWVAQVRSGRVTKVVGAGEHPFTRGVLCAKVNDYPARTYAADRLLYPLRRVGAKGAGEFERVSWDEAITAIATKFAAIIGRHGAEALLPLQYLGSSGVVQRRALLRLFHVLGASQQAGSICGAAGNTLAGEGHPLGFDPEEIAQSELVVLWGANVLTTSHHHWHFMKEAQRRNGAKIVCIDPRRTRTAAACDEHISIVPGSDSVLAAGVAHVLLAEGLADLELFDSVGIDAAAYRRQVEPWTPQRVATICGTHPEQVRALGLAFGRARPAVIRTGIAPQQTVSGETFLRALSALAFLGGHWRRPGGGLFVETFPILHEDRAARPDLAPASVRRVDLARLGEQLADRALDPPVMGVMAWGINIAVNQPDTARVRRALAREELFTVVIEHFMTDTARYADFVLPSTTQLEHFDVHGAWGHHYVSLNEPAIAPLGEAKSHGEIMRLLAARMGLRHPELAKSDQAIAESVLPEGLSLESLRTTGWCKVSPPRPDAAALAGRLGFSGSIAVPERPSDPSLLQLLTPKSHYFLNSSFANMARQRKAMRRPTLEMHPLDARERGLVDGERVVITNDRGSIRAWLAVTDAICPTVVALPGKWWGHPEETSAVANVLSPSAWSPGGQPAYNDTFVYVRSDTNGRAAPLDPPNS